MMGKIIDIHQNEPHLTGELICLKCGYRYIGTWMEKAFLKNLYCPNCNEQGWTIATGQIMETWLSEHPCCDKDHPYPQCKPGQVIQFKPNTSGQEVKCVIKSNKDNIDDKEV